MWFPKPIYEGLPYLYFTAGLLLLFLFRESLNAITLAIATMLYIAGSILWIKRSNARRRDRRENRRFQSQLHFRTDLSYYPQWLYEEQPFIYLAAGFGCYLMLPSLIGFASGSLLIAVSLMVFKSRIDNRKPTSKAQPHA